MEAHKSGKGTGFSQNNYRQKPQIQDRDCCGCGKLGHFARDCPTKKRNNNGVQLKPLNQPKYYWDERPLTDISTNGSMVFNFQPENKCCHEIARNFFASNFHEGFCSRVSDFREDNSSSDSSEDHSSSTSASDSSEDYSSSVTDSSEDCYSSDFSDSLEGLSFAARGNQFEDYFSSAPESSSALHSSGLFSSSVKDSSQVSSSSASDSQSHTDKSEGQDMNELEDWEDQEIQPLQCGSSSIAERGSDCNHQFPICSGVDFPSQITGQGSKESPDSAARHNAVQSIHNLSVLLLINSSFSDDLSESDLQTLQSVICNLSQCLLKGRGVPNPTHVSALMPDKQLVAASSENTEKGWYAAEKPEDPVGTRSSQMSAKFYQSQMAKFEVELNLIKSEFRSLRTKLERKRVKKAHAGTHENRDIETLANRDDVNNGSFVDLNLCMMENDPGYSCAPFSEERSNCLPDLNLDPIMEDETLTGGWYIEKNEDNAISQNNISEEPIQKSSLITIEDYFRIIRDNIGNNLVEDVGRTESPIDDYDL